jgi:hypothetical protein
MKGHGGKREGSGRKPKADELRLIETIKESVSDNDFGQIWKAIADKAKKGSPAHIKLLFEYFYGKPKETIKHELPEDNEIHITKKIINAPGS